MIGKDQTFDVLDVNLPLLCVRLLRQSCKSFLEVLTSTLSITGLAIIILKRGDERKKDRSRTDAYWEEVLDVRVLDFLLKQVVLIQEQDLNGRSVITHVEKIGWIHNRCLFEPL